MSNVEWFRYEWIWEKERPSNILTIKKQAGRVHENLLVFSEGVGVYNPQMMPALSPSSNAGYKSQQGDMNALEQAGGVKTRYSDTYDPKLRYPRSVLKFSRRTKGHKKWHPTQKPVALLEYLIKTYTNEGETVLDNTMGSGSTGVACVNTDREFIGIEIVPRYFKMAEERIENARRSRTERLF
jgi:site-specific DNA-methyltransferase (adenine-specific)